MRMAYSLPPNTQVAGGAHHGEIGRGHAGLPHHELGEGLVHGDGQYVGGRERAGDGIGFEQGGYLRFAADAGNALGNIEDEVPAAAGG